MRKRLLLSLVAAVCCMSMWAQTAGPASNEIWYTSSTGEAIEKFETEMGATSNTYTNGKGVATFEEDVTAIPDQAFAVEQSLTSISLPASVTTIGSLSFGMCSGLSSITFAEGSQLTTLGEGAFISTSLTEIEIPALVSSIPYGTFQSCQSLESVAFAEGSQLTEIGEEAFYECYALNSITLPVGLKKIGDTAFADCGISSIVIPSKVTSIGNQAFGDTGSADGSVTFADGSEYEVLTKGAFCYANFGTIILPNSLTTIEDSSIDCENITSLVIPENVTTIGSTNFNYLAAINAPNLKSLTFAGESKLTTLGSYAISCCSSLSSLVIPASVTTIGPEAFHMSGTADGCLTFAEGSKYTGEGDEGAFEDTDFGTIVLPESMTTLGSYSFAYSNFKSITIPAAVTTIGTGSFAYCENLEEIIIFCTTPPAFGKIEEFDSGMWDGLEDPKPLVVVPSGCKTAYEEAKPNEGETVCWNELPIVEGEPLDVTEVGWASFYTDEALDIPSCAKVYYASAASGSTLTLTEITGTIPAETAVIVQIPAGTLFPISSSTPEAITGNLLKGTSEDITRTEAVYVLSPASTKESPVFQNYTGTTLGAGKAYILASDLNGTESNTLRFVFGETTHIEAVSADTNADAPMYNLQGQRVSDDYRGIVIKNGRKVMIR